MKPPPFQVFLDSHREDVFRFLVALVGPQEAEDCFQETFLSALRAYPNLRDGSNVRGWILTIAHRKALDAHRSWSRRPVPVERVPDGRVNPPAEANPELWELVRELPPKMRAAVVLRFVDDLPYAQIAEITGSSEEASRRSVHEGLKRLRQVLPV